MLEFIICDDNIGISEKIKTIINTIMFDDKMPYNIKIFNDYNKEFENYIKKKKSHVIYILDIVTPSGSGIDMARKIREKDMESVIIFLTGHEELGMTILKDELFFLTFINKYDDYQRRLKRAIKKALLILGNKKTLTLTDNNCTYIVSVNEILYIIRDKSTRKVTVITNDSEITLGKTLKYIMKYLPSYFKYAGRNIIVNIDRIKCIDKTNKRIIMDNDKVVESISKQILGG